MNKFFVKLPTEFLKKLFKLDNFFEGICTNCLEKKDDSINLQITTIEGTIFKHNKEDMKKNHT